MKYIVRTILTLIVGILIVTVVPRLALPLLSKSKVSTPATTVTGAGTAYLLYPSIAPYQLYEVSDKQGNFRAIFVSQDKADEYSVSIDGIVKTVTGLP